MTRKTLVLLAVLAAVPLSALAQTPAARPPISKTEAAEVTATIVTIDHTHRVITLKNEDGEVELGVGPEIKRFDELKVGDTISFRYQESLLVEIAKPGQAGKLPASDDPTITRGKGARPSGSIAQQQKATVTIKAIDPKLSAVTVVNADGHTVSFKVNDKKKLEGWKAGDKVDITYTEALMISVK
jgi:Cu/Ag efflux protein CusF